MARILIVEDEEKIARFVTLELEHEGYQVQDAYDGEEAVELAREGGFDLIILDVYMPQMSGTELLLQLRAKGVDADVIMVTSANDAKTVNDAVRLGAVDYLVKPFAYERFQQALDNFCRHRDAAGRHAVRN